MGYMPVPDLSSPRVRRVCRVGMPAHFMDIAIVLIDVKDGQAQSRSERR